MSKTKMKEIVSLSAESALLCGPLIRLESLTSVEYGTSQPTTRVDGSMWFQAGTPNSYVYNAESSQWIQVGGSAADV